MASTRFRPELVAADAWLAGTATVLGQVHVGSRSSIWFGAVVRGDTDSIYIGPQTNIQDLCCLHVDQGQPCEIGQRVTIGHAAVVHGATVADEVMVGMRAVVMNGARIGRHSIVGAGAVVTENTEIPERSLVLGVPGRVVRQVNSEEVKRVVHAAEHYVSLAAEFRADSGS